MVETIFSEEFAPSRSPIVFPERSGTTSDHLVANYRYLCRRGARKFLRTGLERCDLEQVAAIGLIKAARRFDVAAATPFEAYAWLLIIGELGHYVRDHERAVRAPRTLRALEPSLARAREACIARLGREPSDSELAETMGVLVRTVRDVKGVAAGATTVSLDEAGAERLADDPVLTLEDRMLFDDGFTSLDSMERRVLVGVYVLGLSQLELGRKLGVSPRRIARTRHTALAAMQRRCVS